MTWVVKSVACTGIPLVFTGSMNLIVKEEDLLESLELISQRLGYEAPSTAWSNFSARQQQSLQQQQQQQNGQDARQHHVLNVPEAAGCAPLHGSGTEGDQQKHVNGSSGCSGSCANAASSQQSPHSGNGTNGGHRAGSSSNGFVSAGQRVGGCWVPPDHPLASVESRLRHGGACDVCG